MNANRRDFFRTGATEAARNVFLALEAVGKAMHPHPAPVSPPAPAFLRPPGALPDADFLAACTRCDACIAACPRYSIRKAGHELGPRVNGTPIIIVDQNPCWLCSDLPCIAACEDAALLPLASPAAARMGRVEVDTPRCFAAQGSICDVCVERCPVRPKPIRLTRGAPPAIDDQLCTGCGVCVYLCPADALAVTA